MEENSKTERELLAELVSMQKRTAKRSTISLCLAGFIALVVLAAALVLIPRTARAINDSNALVIDAQESLKNINELIADAGVLIDENTDTVTDAISKIDQVDFDSLNNSIKSLSDILDPIASFFNAFK